MLSRSARSQTLCDCLMPNGNGLVRLIKSTVALATGRRFFGKRFGKFRHCVRSGSSPRSEMPGPTVGWSDGRDRGAERDREQAQVAGCREDARHRARDWCGRSERAGPRWRTGPGSGAMDRGPVRAGIGPSRSNPQKTVMGGGGITSRGISGARTPQNRSTQGRSSTSQVQALRGWFATCQ
jgi:hypothetical protein